MTTLIYLPVTLLKYFEIYHLSTKPKLRNIFLPYCLNMRFGQRVAHLTATVHTLLHRFTVPHHFQIIQSHHHRMPLEQLTICCKQRIRRHPRRTLLKYLVICHKLYARIFSVCKCLISHQCRGTGHRSFKLMKKEKTITFILIYKLTLMSEITFLQHLLN